MVPMEQQQLVTWLALVIQVNFVVDQ